MARTRYSTQHILTTLRRVDERVAGGSSVPAACRELGVPELTYHRWRLRYGGGSPDAASRLDQLERENSRLRRVIADQAQHIRLLALAAGE